MSDATLNEADAFDDHVPFRPLIDGLGLAAGALLSLLSLPPLPGAFATFLWVAVWAVIRFDVALYIIPDSASAAIALLGLLRAAALSTAGPDGDTLGPVALALARGTAAFALFWAIASLHRRLAGRDGLGFGDVKLAGACAIWLASYEALAALEFATCSALLLALAGRRRSRRSPVIPFGAFLAGAAWLVVVSAPASREWLLG